MRLVQIVLSLLLMNIICGYTFSQFREIPVPEQGSGYWMAKVLILLSWILCNFVYTKILLEEVFRQEEK